MAILTFSSKWYSPHIDLVYTILLLGYTSEDACCPVDCSVVNEPCIQLNTTKRKFDEHEMACKDKGGFLVKIDSASKHSKLIAHIAGKVSIAIDQ